MLQRIFANKFLWGNFAAGLMMNDCEKSSRHLWLLWLMNTETAENYKFHVLLSSITYSYLGNLFFGPILFFFFLIDYYWLFFSASKCCFYVDADGGGTYYYYRVSRHNWYLSKTGPKLYGCKRRGN